MKDKIYEPMSKSNSLAYIMHLKGYQKYNIDGKQVFAKTEIEAINKIKKK